MNADRRERASRILVLRVLSFDQDLDEQEAARLSQELQIINTVGDSSGFCIFLGPSLEECSRFYSAFFGETVSAETLANLGWQCMEEEWEFNRRAGLTAADDDLPDCCREEGIGEKNEMKFTVSREAIAQAKVRQAPRDKLYNTSPAG